MTRTHRARGPKRLLLAALLLAAPLALASASSAVTVSLTPVKADPDVNETLPSASGDRIAWTANSVAHPDQPNAFVQQAGHARQRINPAGTFGQSGGFDGSTFVWTQWSSSSAGDIWRINLGTGVRAKFPHAVDTQYGEFAPTLSGNWLLFTRYNWDQKRGRVILFNRSTGNSRVLAIGTDTNWVYSGQVNGDYATFGRFPASTGAQIWRYQISTGTTVKVPNPSGHNYAPSVASDGTVFYGHSGTGCGANADLMRFPVGGPSEKLRDLASGIDLGWTYVDDRADGGREVHLDRVACSRNKARAWDTYKFVDTYQLTVVKSGAGTGTVTGTGINCGSDCTEVVPKGTVTLTAAPDLGSTIAGWSVDGSSVDGCGTSNECAVDVDSSTTVTVTFEPVV